MNKKYLMIALVALVAVGAAYAATVSYLSGTTQVTASVDSPIVATVSTDGETYAATADLGTIYGGETKTFQYKTVNRANGAITGAKTALVISPAVCTDFVEVSLADVSIKASCTETDGGVVVEGSQDYTALETKDSAVAVQLVPNIAPGSLQVTAQVLYG